MTGARDGGSLLIGQVASAAGVGVETLRYYERRGIIAEPARTASGYRCYPPEVVRVVRFIKRAQALGFSLAEIEVLLDLRDDRSASCTEVKALAEAKIDDLDGRVRDLTALRAALEALVRSCRRTPEERHCPILEALENESGAGASTEERGPP